MTYAYKIECDKLYWNDVYVGELPIELGMVFDRTNGGVFKHGKKDDVDTWMSTTAKKLNEADVGEHFDDYVFATVNADEQTIEEINKCIECTGYALKLFPDVMDLRM